MDILKVLSRGTRQLAGKKSGAANATVAFFPGMGGAADATLPSAGSSIHPQLFYDAVGGGRRSGGSSSRKRKRGGGRAADDENGSEGGDQEDEGEEGEEEEDDDDDNSDDDRELDFFGTKADTASATKKTKTKLKKKTVESTPTATTAAADDGVFDEDACRQILRSHRLKVTLLTDRKAAAEEAAAAAAAAAEAEIEMSDKKKSKKKKKAKKEEEAATAATAAAAAAASKAARDDAKKPFFPQPLTAFAQLRSTYRISPRLANNLDRQLYRLPTEVQMGSLPLLLDPVLALSRTAVPAGAAATGAEVDLMALAPTGSGKTLSFLVPAIDSVLKRRAAAAASLPDEEAAAAGERKKEEHVLDTIVVAPTRELAYQIASEGKKLAVDTGVRVVAMRKGMQVGGGGEEEEEGEWGEEEEEEEEEIDDDDSDSDSDDAAAAPKTKTTRRAATPTKADILVTTPLLLLHTLQQQQQKLPTVRTLVLDEADVLLDPLFRDQTLGLWRACTHAGLRTTFWSATMPSSVEELVVRERAERAERRAASSSSSSSSRLLVRLVVGLKDSAVPNVAHRLVYTATEQGKLLAMRQLLHPSTSRSVVAPGASSSSASGSPAADDALRPPFLVFTQTAERATALHDELQYDIPAAAGGSERLGVLHAALSHRARAAVVRKFRAGLVWVLITTDVLARGIDFAGVNGVVHYDVPGSAAAYVHRAGRTGRAGRRGGLSVTLYTKDDIPIVKSVANVIAASERQASGSSGGGSGSSAVPQWLLDALPEVSKTDKQKLKRRGVESRRAVTANKATGSKTDDATMTSSSGGPVANAGKARITSKSAWDRRREHNRREAIAHSKQRKQREQQADKKTGEGEGEGEGEEEWSGFA